MGTPEFPDLGRHCSLQSCQLIDFLPFRCDKCNQIYCLDHRSYGSHQCKFSREGDSNVIVCPLCARAVKLLPHENPNVTWERHTQTNCDPSNYIKVTKKKKCPVAGCKESLTFSNKVLCKDCHQEVCLKHRFGPDHACAEAIKKAKDASSIFNRSFYQGFKDRAWEMASSSGLNSLAGYPSNSSSKKSTTSSTPKNSASGKHAKPSSKPPQTHQVPVKSGMSSITDSISSTFSSFTSLINQQITNSKDKRAHDVLPKNKLPKTGVVASSDQGGSGLEVCPRCQATFHDVSELILHVDEAHVNGNDSVKSVQIGFNQLNLKKNKP